MAEYEDRSADEFDGYVEAADDLTDVTDPTLPEAGWHRVKVGVCSAKPHKDGRVKRAVKMDFPNYYSHWENYFIAIEGNGGEIARRRWKAFAKACGVEERADGKFLFKPSDLNGAELYVLIKVDTASNFPVSITTCRPITDPPENITEELPVRQVKQEQPEDDLPF